MFPPFGGVIPMNQKSGVNIGAWSWLHLLILFYFTVGRRNVSGECGAEPAAEFVPHGAVPSERQGQSGLQGYGFSSDKLRH